MFKSRFLAAVLLIIIIPACSVQSSGQENSIATNGPRQSVRLFGLRGLKNVGLVAPGIYRGAQPDDEGYFTLKQMGIKTVVNLRAKHSEHVAVEKAGMRSVEIPMDILDKVDSENVKEALKVITSPSNQPVYFHCALGEDRTGLVAAIYRIENDGWTPKEAFDEMQAFGFNDIWIGIRKFVLEYKPGEGGVK